MTLIRAYDEAELERRASRVEPFELFLLEPTAREVERSYAAVCENKPETVRAERRANGVLLRWSFRGESAALKPCVQCGAGIPTGRRSTAKYCSDDCENVAHAQRKRDERANDGPRACAWCEAPISGRKVTAVYCSLKCRTRAETYRKRGPGAPEQWACLHCGEPIHLTARRDKTVCNVRCRLAMRYRTNEEFRARLLAKSRHRRKGQPKRACTYCGLPLAESRKHVGTCTDACTRLAGQVTRQNARRIAA